MSPTSIDNGQRVPVKCPLYAGQAGVRTTSTGGEFSAMATLALGQAASDGLVDGRAVRILGARVSSADKRMIVVDFAWSDGK